MTTSTAAASTTPSDIDPAEAVRARRAWTRDGYLAGGALLSPTEVAELRLELDRVIAEQGRGDIAQPSRISNLGGREDAPVWQIVNIWQASPAFARLLRHPRLVARAALLAGGRELRLWHDQIQYKPAAIGGVNMWHQDAPYWQPLAPQDQQLTAWIALDDADVDNGCMSMVPGSHRWGDAIGFLHTLRSFEDMPGSLDGRRLRVVPRPVAAGHVHFHHSLTWHGSPANRSGRPRRAIALHFMNERTVLRPEGSHLLRREITVQPGEAVQGPLFPLLWRAP